MNTILSFENTLSWSWGIAIKILIDNLKDEYKFIRVPRFTYTHFIEKEEKTVQAPLAKGLIEHFDVTLVQNLDSIRLMQGKKGKAVARIGGLTVGNGKKTTRYDDQLKQVGAVVACNDQLFEIGNRVNDHCYMIPNGVDLDKFKPPDNPDMDRQFTVGFVGNVWGQGADYKGWKFYVKAVQIELVGEVDSKHLLHSEYNISNDEMPGYYHSIDCLIMPSLNEGCSNTIKEALACGVPVLCTKVGFHGERLEDGKDALFIERDSKDISEKILMLRDDRELRMKLAFNGRLFAENYHDIRKIALEYDKIFQDVIGRNKNEF